MAAAVGVADPVAPPTRPRLAPALAIWGAIAAAVLVLQFAAGAGESAGLELDGQLFDGLNQFDGPEYLQIATDGYLQRQLVWFPAYPLAIRAIDAIVGDPLASAVLATLAASAVAAVLYVRWLADRGLSARARRVSLLCLLLYPYAWFLYGVVYADALFLALCLAAFVLADREHRGWAAVAAAVATATRPSGFALVAGLVVFTLERDGVLVAGADRGGWRATLGLPTRLDLHRLRPATFWPLAGLAGLATYSAYQWRAFGSPLRFLTEQDNYHEPGTASALKQQYFAAFYEGFDGRHLATTTFQALLLVAVIIAVPAVGRRFGWGSATFVLGLALLPALSVSTFMGVGRYLLPAFPVFALVGERLAARRGAAPVWLVTSGALMALMAFGFSRSWYLS